MAAFLFHGVADLENVEWGWSAKDGSLLIIKLSDRFVLSGLVIEIGSPDRSYRPQPRPMLLTVRSQPDAARVSVGGVSLSRVDDLEKVERGWSVKDGSLMIKLPDRFERVEIRIE